VSVPAPPPRHPNPVTEERSPPPPSLARRRDSQVVLAHAADLYRWKQLTLEEVEEEATTEAAAAEEKFTLHKKGTQKNRVQARQRETEPVRRRPELGKLWPG
ncbi:unnamed protein product, partial [Mesocestoides corti]|uniref:Protein phosphatase 1 regulatory subunit 35 n=1 Tax=Mesocestoides corti TaxID=53468 RepID=A0A0R3UQA4_MESCO